MKARRVAVIGGGLAGLCAARALERRGHTVVVLEAAERLGGQLQTERAFGYVIEHGAEGFVARSELAPRLAHAVGLGDALCGQLATRTLGFRGGELRELLPGEAAKFLGFQVPKADLGAGIRSLRDGMGSLIDALADSLAARVEVHLGREITKLERRSKGYLLTSRDGNSIATDRVVIATTAKHAARLLSAQLGPAALQLGAAATLTSSVTVSLAYERAAIAHPLDATGFVLASEEQTHGARACAFVSSKLPHRAPADRALLRVFFRPEAAELTLTSDATFATRARDVITRVLAPSASPERSWVSRWPEALPVFDDGLREAVSSLETAMAGSGIALAGSAFHGAGIDAALRSAAGVHERL